MFGAVKLPTNTDPVKYGYSSYSIGYNAQTPFSLAKGESGKIVVILGVDDISLGHVCNRKKDILILNKVQQID